MKIAQTFDFNLEGRTNKHIEFIDYCYFRKVIDKAQESLEEKGYTFFRSGGFRDQSPTTIPKTIILIGESKYNRDLTNEGGKIKNDFFGSAREMPLLYTIGETCHTDE